MRQQARLGAATALIVGHAALVATLTVGIPLPASAAVEITHAGVGCVVAGQFPVIKATLSPAGDVARARVYFHGRGTPSWYYVEMKGASGDAFEGTLPQPLATLAGIEYYIEALAKGFDERRSPEYDADVIASSASCPSGRTTATMISSVTTAIRVGAPQGAAAVPAGFASVGLGAGGVSTALLVGIGAAAAAGGAIAVGTGGGDDGSSGAGSPTTPTGGTPTPTPTPTPAPMRDVSGRWTGTFNENPNPTRCTVQTDLSLQLQQTGTAVSGTFQMLIRTATSVPADPCPVGAGDVLNGPVSGVVNGDQVSLELGIPGGGPSLRLHGSVSDDRMGGTDPAGGGSWDVRRQ